MSIKFSPKGIRAMLRSDGMHQIIDDLASQIATAARADMHIQQHGAQVIVESYETDRAAAAVLIKHPAALGIEGKYGVLTAAAAEAGITISEPKHARS